MARRRLPFEITDFTEPKPALKALDAEFWDRVMKLTDVYDTLPQERRDKWNDNISEHTTVEFTRETVIPTMTDLLQSRQMFLAERVDGIFRGLSGCHATNSPAGFGKRMIISDVMDSHGFTNYRKCGLISDLRAVVARIQGRGEPGYNASSYLLDYLKQDPGTWHPIDGGALRLKLFKKGTAHLEVEEEMAVKLNRILSVLYPSAIAEKHRKKKTPKKSEARSYNKLLSFDVINLLSDFRVTGHSQEKWTAYPDLSPGIQKELQEQVGRILELAGGRRQEHFRLCFHFDYDPSFVLREVVLTGEVPDLKSHQFYPTPDRLVKLMYKRAEVEKEHLCLEPSAGAGAIALRHPFPDQLTCVEISGFFCRVLSARMDADVREEDFLTWAKYCSHRRYDRILMNPPFSKNQAALHLETAAGLLAEKGRLVAVLPASLRGRELFEGFTWEWSDVYENAFAGTSVRVVILTLEPA